MGQLTITEAKRFAEYELTIRNGLNSWMDVSNAMIKIHDNELYREKSETFEAYCFEEFGLSRSRAYQLIESGKTVEILSTIVDIPAPSNEGIARELSKVETDEAKADVWVKACETAQKAKDGTPKPTAAHVAKTSKAMFPPAESNGAAEPVDAIKSWIQKIDAIRRDIDEVRPRFKTQSKEWQTVLDELDAGRMALARLVK